MREARLGFLECRFESPLPYEAPRSDCVANHVDGDGAAMFGVFSPYEKQLLHDWIAGDWTPSEKNPAPRRSRQVATPEAAVPEHDPDVQRLMSALQGQDGHAQMATLIPWLSPARHAHPAGLLATRRFIELKSSLR